MHQTLHGYAEGHRQIATSVTLKPRDAKTMLILSDISGPGAGLDDVGYLTGYPLTDAGFYAFAKTWPAPEMPRPGCVWTHTLLIDFADLATVPSLTELLNAFRRPTSGVREGFSGPVTVELSSLPAKIDPPDEPLARKIVGALYGKASSKIISARPSACSVERVVTVLWSQQWPRLRRSFRFCTLSMTDRSVDKASFDLQFLPAANQALRTRFSRAVDADEVSAVGAWLDEALSDLVRPSTPGLRSFLRQIGGDVPGGRDVFGSLCQLYGLTTRFSSDHDALEAAMHLMEEDFRGAPARAAHMKVAVAALPRAQELSDAGLNYLLDHVALIEPSMVEATADELGRAVLRRRPVAFGEMLGADDTMRRVAMKALARATEGELLAAMATAPGLAYPFLQHRPELAAAPEVWSRNLRAEESAFEALRSGDQAQLVLGAMMKAGRTDLAARACGKLGALEVLQAISSAMRSEALSRSDCEAWLRAAAHPSAVAQLFSGAEALPRQLLASLARTLQPDDVPNDFGEDPWLSAMYRACGLTSEADETRLFAFLLARSLGRRSRSQAELAQLAFEHIHAAASTNYLPEDSWRLLDPLLPWSILWFDWDRCPRLRAGVVDLFVERRLAPAVFGRLVRDEGLFGLLADKASRIANGRAYLKDVHHALVSSKEDLYSERRRLIKNLLK